MLQAPLTGQPLNSNPCLKSRTRPKTRTSSPLNRWILNFSAPLLLSISQPSPYQLSRRTSTPSTHHLSRGHKLKSIAYERCNKFQLRLRERAQLLISKKPTSLNRSLRNLSRASKHPCLYRLGPGLLSRKGMTLWASHNQDLGRH